MINEAPSSLANNSAIAVGFALGVALFVVVGKFCGDADDGGGDETRSRLRTVSSANSACSEAGHAPKSKLGMMKDSMCEADYEVVSEAPRFPRYPTTMVLAVLVDALCDGFLIGVAAASGTNAGLIMAIALTIEMGFLSLTFATTLRRQPRAVAFVSIALPPACLMLGGVLGASTANVVSRTPALHVGLVSFGVAALLYLVTEELLLEAHESHEGHIWWVDCCFFLGFLMSFLLDKLL